MAGRLVPYLLIFAMVKCSTLALGLPGEVVFRQRYFSKISLTALLTDRSFSFLEACLPLLYRTSSLFLTVALQRFWVILNPKLRVIANIPFPPDSCDVAEVLSLFDHLPPPERFADVELQPHVLYLQNVLEPEVCRRLIGFYEVHGGEESGFTREIDGRKVDLPHA